jgi:hypothetical protein
VRTVTSHNQFAEFHYEVLKNDLMRSLKKSCIAKEIENIRK